MSGSCSYGPGLAVSSDEGRILYLLPSVNTNESQRMVHICLPSSYCSLSDHPTLAFQLNTQLLRHHF